MKHAISFLLLAGLGMGSGAAVAAAGCDIPERCTARQELLSWCKESPGKCGQRRVELESQCTNGDRNACHEADWIRQLQSGKVTR